jgi:hypothetical protein
MDFIFDRGGQFVFCKGGVALVLKTARLTNIKQGVFLMAFTM